MSLTGSYTEDEPKVSKQYSLIVWPILDLEPLIPWLEHGNIERSVRVTSANEDSTPDFSLNVLDMNYTEF